MGRIIFAREKGEGRRRGERSMAVWRRFGSIHWIAIAEDGGVNQRSCHCDALYWTRMRVLPDAHAESARRKHLVAAL